MRRYCVFLTPQQTKDDLARDGMDGLYFPKLRAWLYEEDGFALSPSFSTRMQSRPSSILPASATGRPSARLSTTLWPLARGELSRTLRPQSKREPRASGAAGYQIRGSNGYPGWSRATSRAISAMRFFSRWGTSFIRPLKNGRTDHPVRPDEKESQALRPQHGHNALPAQERRRGEALRGLAQKMSSPASFPVDHTVSSMNVPRP